MGKSIKLNYKDKQYLLEFDRDSVKIAERRGLRIEQLFESPAIQMPLFFQCAFIKHHKFLPVDVIDNIYDEVKDVSDLIPKLVECYNEPLEALLGVGENANAGKKAVWEANF